MLGIDNYKKEIYLIRHGETKYNRLNMVQGSGIDADLNAVGLQQASVFYRYYSLMGFDKIYISKLRRTYQSVTKFIADGIPHTSLEGLNEISWGAKEGKIITDKDDKQYFDMLHAWESGNYHAKIAGGESPFQVQQRQKRAWKYIMAHEHEKKILVCMHGRAIRILLCLLMGLPLDQMGTFQHKNLCLYKIVYQPDVYNIVINNTTEHLQGMKKS